MEFWQEDDFVTKTFNKLFNRVFLVLKIGAGFQRMNTTAINSITHAFVANFVFDLCVVGLGLVFAWVSTIVYPPGLHAQPLSTARPETTPRVFFLPQDNNDVHMIRLA